MLNLTLSRTLLDRAADVMDLESEEGRASVLQPPAPQSHTTRLATMKVGSNTTLYPSSPEGSAGQQEPTIQRACVP